MTKVYCDKCGALLNGRFEPSGNTGMDAGICSSCSKCYNETELDGIRNHMSADEIMAVDSLRAASMLARPGDKAWVGENLSHLGFWQDGIYYIPVSSVRSFAEKNGLQIIPLDENSPMPWVLRHRYD